MDSRMLLTREDELSKSIVTLEGEIHDIKRDLAEKEGLLKKLNSEREGIINTLKSDDNLHVFDIFEYGTADIITKCNSISIIEALENTLKMKLSFSLYDLDIVGITDFYTMSLCSPLQYIDDEHQKHTVIRVTTSIQNSDIPPYKILQFFQVRHMSELYKCILNPRVFTSGRPKDCTFDFRTFHENKRVRLITGSYDTEVFEYNSLKLTSFNIREIEIIPNTYADTIMRNINPAISLTREQYFSKLDFNPSKFL